MRLKIAPTYDIKFLETDRPQPLADNKIESIIQNVLNGEFDKDITDTVYTNFKKEMCTFLDTSLVNKLTGLNTFDRIDIINGCTQFIDNLYMQGPVQVIAGDYRYHSRLDLALIKNVGMLIPNIPLVIAMPFPSVGGPHIHMQEILDECQLKHIPVHVDGAWVTCCKDIQFDFSHPSICSVGISLSKGLGLGWNRIGLRWSKNSRPDSISIMNDFHMNIRASAMIGLHFIRSLPIDYLWNTHSNRYYKICNDFNLTPTQSIYLALQNSAPVGVSPLIRYLENNE